MSTAAPSSERKIRRRASRSKSITSHSTAEVPDAAPEQLIQDGPAAPPDAEGAPTAASQPGEEGTPPASEPALAKKKKKKKPLPECPYWINWASFEYRVFRRAWLALSASTDNTVKVWDVDQLEARACRATLARVHEKRVNFVTADLRAKRAISGASDGTLALWDLEKCDCQDSFLSGKYGPMYCIDANFACKRAVTGTGKGILCIWDTNRLVCKRTIEAHPGARITVVRAEFSNVDKCRAVSGAFDGRFSLWDLDSCFGSWDGEFACLSTFEAQPSRITAVAVDFQVGESFIGLETGALHIWALDGEQRPGSACILNGHGDRVNIIKADFESGRAISGSNDDTARVWDLKIMQCCGVFEGHTQAVRDVFAEFTRNFAVTASDDSSLRIWDIAMLACTNVLEGHTDRVTSVRANLDKNDGGMLLSGSDDYTLRVWDLESMECTKTFFGHSGGIVDVASPPLPPPEPPRPPEDEELPLSSEPPPEEAVDGVDQPEAAPQGDEALPADGAAESSVNAQDALFGAIDANRDGVVDREEFALALQAEVVAEGPAAAGETASFEPPPRETPREPPIS